LVAVALLAMWTRLQYVDLYGGRAESYSAWASEHYFGGLSEFYLSAAARLVSHGEYTELHHPPGYPYILAALNAIGIKTVRAIRITQSAFDAVIVFVVYRLARRLSVSRGWALFAAIAYALWPLFAIGATWPLAESLSVGLVAVMINALVWAASAPHQGVKASVCGGLIGMSALIRPDLILLIVPALMWLLVAGGARRWMPLTAAIVACAVPLVAWGAHNRRTHGAWIFGSTSSGLNLWEGLGELPNNYGYVLDDSAANHALMANGYTWGSVEADRYFRREYLRAWREHPTFVVHAMAVRVGHVLFESEHLQPLFFGRARQMVDALGALFVVLAALVRRNRVAWFVLLLPPLYAVFSIGLMHYEPRYVRYVQLSYLLAAVVLADEAWRWMNAHNRIVARSAVVAAVLLSSAYVTRELYALHRAVGLVSR